MPLAKCPRSGKLFDNSKTPVHPDVMAAEEADYHKIVDYVRENPHCTQDEAAEATEVDITCVQRCVKLGLVSELGSKEVQEYNEDQKRREDEAIKRQLKLQGALKTFTSKAPESGPDKSRVRDMLEEKRRT